ncbi:AraC family transcriptional regulator [Proteus myxofaciens]|uniref:AraC family transcriptional regulator n=1 Tax=Proteus myxofaciens ATCC 19692 TaxID=1354337 RepID=A0A198GGA1_9GAMM|nr:helix-turn-helix transcriptional regulator [Proteus myxofaciens]OAT35246.1 AraC family transcriptional regulator [Proteus myxofaciens ATCC 19692]
MRNIDINDVDNLPRDILALGSDYPYDTLLETHHHRRAQFLYAPSGVMKVKTEDGQWVVLPYSGVWIPAEKHHQVLMLGSSTYSLYIEPDKAPRNSEYCEVIQVSPLLYQLLLSANELPLLYDKQGRDNALLALLCYEISLAKPLPYFTPLPQHAVLDKLCTEFISQPNIMTTPELWAKELNKSLRTFTRLFHKETGLSFRVWRQRACLMYALTALKKGHSITKIALDLGYENPSAFSAMFNKEMGYSPSAFLKQLKAC